MFYVPQAPGENVQELAVMAWFGSLVGLVLLLFRPPYSTYQRFIASSHEYNNSTIADMFMMGVSRRDLHLPTSACVTTTKKDNDSRQWPQTTRRLPLPALGQCQKVGVQPCALDRAPLPHVEIVIILAIETCA